MNKGGFSKKSMRDIPLDGKTVLVRADYNVPISDGVIRDDYRIRASVPTIQALLDRGSKVVIMAHLGRPKGERNLEFSLEPVAERLSQLLDKKVIFIDDCIGDVVTVAVKQAPPKSVLLLQNVRFYPGDETNDSEFARQLKESSQAAYFIQDGFGVAHRAQASTDAITQFLPSVAGLLLEKEVTSIQNAIENPKRPLVAVMGGAKISDKIQLVERFIALADKVIIGGAMANNFLKYKGFPVGQSLVEEGVDETIAAIYAAAEQKVGKEFVDDFLIIPKDVAVGDGVDENTERVDKALTEVRDDEKILDIGPKTMDTIDRELQKAGTVIWNGTLGYSELPQFAHGSARLALHLASHPEIVSVIGGGDTADFVLHWDARHGDSFTLVSTGGGASLELMSGQKLPGVEALMDA
jgi:phosphoglycerate kinase